MPALSLGSVGAFAVTLTGNQTLQGVKTFAASNATTTPLVVQGFASQTAPFQNWTNSAGTVLAQVQANGNVNAASGSFAMGNNNSLVLGADTGIYSKLHLTLADAGQVGVAIKLAASQTANALSIVNSAGTTFLSIDGNGAIHTPHGQPIQFTNLGTGIFNRTVFYQGSNGFTIDLARATDSGSGTILPFRITSRGGSTGGEVTIADGRVTDNGHIRAMSLANFIMLAPGQDSAPNNTPARWDGTNFIWYGRLLALAAGRGPGFANISGHYSFMPPAVGTVIPGYGGAGNVTVTASGIPIPTHSALYAVVNPLGDAAAYTYAIVSYTAGYTIPSNYVLIASYTENQNSARLRTGWGTTMDFWRNPTFVNGWGNYGQGYNFGQFYKDHNGFVHLRGLVSGGPYGSNVIFNLPQGYRPANRVLRSTIASEATARVDITPNGDVLAIVGSGWLTLEGISFLAEN